jgi:FkbM family methyltransferase
MIFLKKAIRRLLSIFKSAVIKICVKMSLLGAKDVGVTSYGNNLLRLNKDYALGRKGTVLELPKDDIIYKYVKFKGNWELTDCRFLARGLKKACMQLQLKTALIDIGANTGLVSLQTMNLSGTKNDLFLFEPVPRHAMAIRNNLKSFLNVHLGEFALSDKDGKAAIYTQATNHGNSSLFDYVVPASGMISTQIELVNTEEYCKSFLNNYECYVIKCDTQGMDALILSRFADLIWQNCESAVIEVWALPEVKRQDVDRLLAKFQGFNYVSWYPDGSLVLALEEVSQYWLSKSGSQRNLYLSKTLL